MNMNLRWRDQRSSRRPAGEPIETHRYEVAEIPDDRTAKAFVQRHHYSGTFPAAQRRIGLYRGAELVGVAVFSVGVNARTYDCLPGEPGEHTQLGRFVLLDDVPGNGETWFLARCFELIRDRFLGVVSFSDPAPRSRASGEVVFPGHVGTIYQAHNAVYLGQSKRDTVHLLPDATVLSPRAMAKIRRREQGWEYSAGLLIAAGAAPLEPGEDGAAWLSRWLPRCTRRFRHPGNHKYAWLLDRRARRHWRPQAVHYPKMGDRT